jgi:hypothetical protein
MLALADSLWQPNCLRSGPITAARHCAWELAPPRESVGELYTRFLNNLIINGQMIHIELAQAQAASGLATIFGKMKADEGFLQVWGGDCIARNGARK